MDDKQKERIKEGIAKYFKSNIENQPIKELENGTLEYLEDTAIKEIANQLKFTEIYGYCLGSYKEIFEKVLFGDKND